MIILDEKSYAEELLKYGSKTSYPKIYDIIVLAKYYKFQGKETHEIRLLLEEYCKKTDKDWNKANSGWKIRKALNTIKIYRLRTTFPIAITKAEVEIIKQWKDYRYQKIVFVLIVMAKFLKYSNTRIEPSTKAKGIGEFFVNEKMSTIVKIARVPMRKEKRNSMFHEFHNAGILDGTTYNSLKIKCINESSDPEIIVTDYENLVLYWQRYCGESVAGCKCGRLFLKRSNRHSMCRICWKERELEIKKNYWAKINKKSTRCLEK